MERKFYFLIVLLVFITTTNIYSQCTTMEHIRMNIVYKGIENTMNISNNYKGEIEVTASQGVLTKQSYGYSYYTEKEGTVSISILVDGVIKKSHSFRVKELPKPFFKIDDFDSRILEKENLKDFKELKGRLLDFEYFIQPVISSFMIKVIQHNGEVRIFKNKGNMFSDEFLSYILNLKENDVIIISDITYDYVYFPGRKQEKFIKKGESTPVVYVIQ